MVRIKLEKDDIRIGEPTAWNIYNAHGFVLLKKGLRIHSTDRLEQLLRFELYYDPEEATPPSAQPAPLEQSAKVMEQHCKHPFDTVSSFASDLESSYQSLLVCSENSHHPITAMANHIEQLATQSPDCCLGAVHLYYPHSYSLMQPVYSAIMCALTAHILKYDHQRIVSLCSAALTSNLGMYRFQDELNHQKEPLNQQQRDKINEHPQRGVQMLQAAGLGDNEWLEMVLQHHERDDCSGYPFGIDSKTLHPGSKIISLADSYLAMISNRAYRGAVQPNIALKKIYHLANKDDPTAFLAFIKTLGVFPPGTFVKLENGEIAVVTAHSEENSLNCQVISIYDKNMNMLQSPIIRDTADSRYAINSTYQFDIRPTIDIKNFFTTSSAVA